MSRVQLLQRLEKLESTIKKERVAAVNIELEARRLNAMKGTKERDDYRRNEKGSFRKSRSKRNQDPGYVTTYLTRKGLGQTGFDENEFENRSITSELSILETPRYPRRASDITRHIDQVGKGTYKGTRHETFDNRRRRSDVTLSTENYLCAIGSPVTMPTGLKYGIKYDNLVQEGETLYINQTYKRIEQLKSGKKGKVVKDEHLNELENGWR